LFLLTVNKKSTSVAETDDNEALPCLFSLYCLFVYSIRLDKTVFNTFL
jgi:hypothetical protein